MPEMIESNRCITIVDLSRNFEIERLFSQNYGSFSIFLLSCLTSFPKEPCVASRYDGGDNIEDAFGLGMSD